MEKRHQRLVLLLFFGSGATGLLYQVVWIRLFVHVFGATVLAVSTVLAAFMGGLAIGGFFGGRIVARVSNPLRTYGLLEIGLTLYAAGVPWILQAANPLYGALYPALEGSFWALAAVRFVVSSLILMPPTILMGATLPILTAHAERSHVGARQRVAHLYSINTFGAVAGTLLASLVLLPQLGMSRTLAAGVGLNLLVGVAAILLARGRARARPEAVNEITEETTIPSPIARPLLLLTAGVLGFSALAFEVLWTRTLTLALGTTTYAFAIVLSVFLLGIASGSAAAGRLLRRPDRATGLFVAIPAMIGLLALLIVPVFDRLPDLFVRLSTSGSGTWEHGLLTRFLVAGLPLLLPTFLSGAAFPLAVGIDRSAAGTSRSVGDVYAANTFGAILGSWTAGFVFVPLLGLRTGIELAAGLQIAMSCVLLFRWSGESRARARGLGLALVGATVLAMFLLPDWNRARLTRGGFALAVDLRRYGQTELAIDRTEIVFLEEGINSTITVRQWGDELTMQMNGITEASNTGDLATQVMVGGFGGILHEDPRDVLVIGLGSGITAAAAARHPGVETIECVEISEAVVHAAGLFRESNHGILDDPRFRMIIGDGRNHLRLAARSYDVIVSQPSNVWNSGIGALMSSEFYRLARAHLRRGGILCSWIQGYSLSPDALRSVLAAVSESFPVASLWMAGWGDLVIIAGDETFGIDFQALFEKGMDPAIREMLLEADCPDMLSLLSRNILAGQFLTRYVGDARPNNDDNLYLEFAAPKFLYRETMRELFESLHAAAGGTEEIVRHAPPELVAELPRARRARELESIGRLAFRENRGDEGLRAIEEAYRLHPTAPSIADVLAQAINGRGETFARRQSLESAVQSYLRAAELRPDFGQPFANLSQLYEDAGQLPTAREAIDEAILREPNQPDHHAQKAGLLIRMNDLDGARVSALRSLEIDRRHHDGHLFLAEALMRLGAFAEADSVFEEGLAFHGDSERLAAMSRRLRSLRESAP